MGWSRRASVAPLALGITCRLHSASALGYLLDAPRALLTGSSLHPGSPNPRLIIRDPMYKGRANPTGAWEGQRALVGKA